MGRTGWKKEAEGKIPPTCVVPAVGRGWSMGIEAEGTNGISPMGCPRLPWPRVRDDIKDPERLWACLVGVDTGELALGGVAGAGREVLIPGSLGALLEGAGANGSLATVLCEVA